MLIKSKVIVVSASIFAFSLASFCLVNNTSAIEESVQFQANVKDYIGVSVTTPTEWARGNVNTFLRNKISFNVTTNGQNGFVASMATKASTTDLVHTGNKGTIPTLTGNTTRATFPTNHWGYSINDTDGGSDSSTYSALVGAGSAPITLISNAQSQTVSGRDIFFGAKADTSVPSGKYASTVVISVVTGVVDPATNPITPVDPARPSTIANTPIYSGAGTTTGGTTNGATTYTYSRTNTTNHTNTTTTEVSNGDNRSSYQGYVPPQGVVSGKASSEESSSESSPLVTGLAITSAIAAASGATFFFVAKGNKEGVED